MSGIGGPAGMMKYSGKCWREGNDGDFRSYGVQVFGSSKKPKGRIPKKAPRRIAMDGMVWNLVSWKPGVMAKYRSPKFGKNPAYASMWLESFPILKVEILP